jgi:hypothetical protein
MKKLIIFFLIAPLIAYSQENKKDKIAFDLLYSPDFGIQPPQSINTRFYQDEAYQFGFNLGQFIDKGNRFSLRIGLRYIVYNQRIESVSLSQTSNQYVNSTTITKLEYYAIPLAIGYKFGQKKLQFYSELIAIYDLRDDKKSLKESINYGFSFGLEYKFLDKFSIFFQPTFRVPLIKNNFYNYNLGIEMGLKFMFPEF